MKILTFNIKLAWLIRCCHMLWIYDDLKIDSIWLFFKFPIYLFNNPWKENDQRSIITLLFCVTPKHLISHKWFFWVFWIDLNNIIPYFFGWMHMLNILPMVCCCLSTSSGFRHKFVKKPLQSLSYMWGELLRVQSVTLVIPPNLVGLTLKTYLCIDPRVPIMVSCWSSWPFSRFFTFLFQNFQGLILMKKNS